LEFDRTYFYCSFRPELKWKLARIKIFLHLTARNQPLCGNVRIEAWLHATDAAAAPRDRRDGGFDATGTAAAHSPDDDPPRCLLPGEDLLSSFPLLSSALSAPNSRPRSRSSPLSHRVGFGVFHLHWEGALVYTCDDLLTKNAGALVFHRVCSPGCAGRWRIGRWQNSRG
jgi:hypothetical protein